MPKLRLSRRADELFRSLDPSAQEALDSALLKLRIDPRSAGTELHGRMRGTWRLREGGYRILYKLRDNGNLVVVESIRLRYKAYQSR